MKNIITFVVALFALTSINAQTVYKGTVSDSSGPLPGAVVISKSNPNNKVETDFDGNFKIELENSTVIVKFIGLKTKEVNLKNFNLIKLEEDVNSLTSCPIMTRLDPVLITASRESQKRKEVPASVGIITSRDLEQTKAFGIEQVVNQVPGVYMSASASAGNEQHMMAIRTPISTKALFLFLEDGLPIRPVAVFNHNALLEMNNTSFGRVEVLKGPASSIYGSEAIGGSINFITKNPSKDFTGSISLEGNTLSLRKIATEFSTTANDKYGFYLGIHKVQRKDGFIEHSDYDKFAITFKNVNDFSESLRWTNAMTFIDFETDMGSTSLSGKNYLAAEYKSNHTFAERTARALRFRSTLDKKWNENNKTSFNVIYRDNEMGQIPHYRIKMDKKRNGIFGEVNLNKFKSVVGLAQHKINFDFAKSSLIVGGTVDFSKQNYWAKDAEVTYNKTTEKYTSYKLNGLYRMFYDADILNYAGYAQFEISPLEKLKFTGAIRYDAFKYDYDNKDEGKSGVADEVVNYTNVSPKLGLNYNLSNDIGFYTNYSKGFTPPQISSLFRSKSLNGKAFELKPTNFDSYEFGGFAILNNGLKIDLTAYRLDGKNRKVSTTNDQGRYVEINAGKTRSQGVELGLSYKVLKNLIFDYSGSYASHKFLEFSEAVKNRKTKKYTTVSHDNTAMPTAPNYIAMASLKYTPIENLMLTLQHEQIGKYNTSFEDGAKIDGKKGTSVYDGHHLFNLKANYKYKNFDVWAQGLNLFDKLYSTRVSYRYGKNNYNVGAPRAFHFGVKYNL